MSRPKYTEVLTSRATVTTFFTGEHVRRSAFLMTVRLVERKKNEIKTESGKQCAKGPRI